MRMVRTLELSIWVNASLQLLMIVELDSSTSPRCAIHSILCVEEAGQTCQIWFQSCGLELRKQQKRKNTSYEQNGSYILYLAGSTYL